MAQGEKRKDPFAPVSRTVNGKKRWILDIPAKIYGRRFRAAFELELEAVREGERIKAQIREKGISSLHVPAGRSLEDAARLFLEYKRPRTGARNFYLLKTYLDDLVGFCGAVEVAAVTGLQLEKWFCRENWAEGSRHQAFSYARMFFNWLERHDFVEKNPARRCEPPGKGEQKNHCLRKADWLRLIELTEKETPERGWICLGLFGGLRTGEIQKLDWEMVNFKTEEIHVPPKAAKKTTGIPDRYVAMTPAFLLHAPRTLTGPVCPLTEKNFRLHRERLIKAMGWPCWPENCLRDTYASNDLANCEDAGKTAYRMGHSDAKMVQRVYARAVTRADARVWLAGKK